MAGGRPAEGLGLVASLMADGVVGGPGGASDGGLPGLPAVFHDVGKLEVGIEEEVRKYTTVIPCEAFSSTR